uniref:Putative ovule protein n=1 Tax=Solanum chacoense TaxID=4108 RepID=A0A0V0GL01_SOLCH
MDQMNKARVRGWWEAMDQFNAVDITKFKEWLNTAEGLLNVQLKQLENGASSSVQSPPEDGSN